MYVCMYACMCVCMCLMLCGRCEMSRAVSMCVCVYAYIQTYIHVLTIWNSSTGTFIGETSVQVTAPSRSWSNKTTTNSAMSRGGTRAFCDPAPYNTLPKIPRKLEIECAVAVPLLEIMSYCCVFSRHDVEASCMETCPDVCMCVCVYVCTLWLLIVWLGAMMWKLLAWRRVLMCVCMYVCCIRIYVFQRNLSDFRRRKYLFDHICMYVFDHICMYVSDHICMYLFDHICMYVSDHICMYVSDHICMYVSDHICMCLTTYVCMCLTTYE